MKKEVENIAINVRNRMIGDLSPHVLGYVTDGGTYIIASKGNWTDSGLPRDLVAVLPAPFPESRVVPLTPLANPEFVEALRKELDHVA